MKAFGTGLATPLDDFDVSVAPAEPARLLNNRIPGREAEEWGLWDVDVGQDYCAAVAASGNGGRILLRRWQEQGKDAPA